MSDVDVEVNGVKYVGKPPMPFKVIPYWVMGIGVWIVGCLFNGLTWEATCIICMAILLLASIEDLTVAVVRK